jgi:hypothetical protein
MWAFIIVAFYVGLGMGWFFGRLFRSSKESDLIEENEKLRGRLRELYGCYWEQSLPVPEPGQRRN